MKTKNITLAEKRYFLNMNDEKVKELVYKVNGISTKYLNMETEILKNHFTKMKIKTLEKLHLDFTLRDNCIYSLVTENFIENWEELCNLVKSENKEFSNNDKQLLVEEIKNSFKMFNDNIMLNKLTIEGIQKRYDSLVKYFNEEIAEVKHGINK